MAGNGSKPGDSVVERLREKYAASIQQTERHLTGAKIREEMASSDFEDDSAVIRAEVDRVMATKSDSKPPGPIRWLWGTLDRLPPGGRVAVVLTVLIVAGGLLGWRGAAWLGWVP